MMSNHAKEYESQLRQRWIDAFDESILKDIEENHPKFETNGEIKPFYGSTCIAWIDQQPDLFQRLCVLQEDLKKALDQAGVSEFFAFLDPPSFHMTVCDIDSSSDYRQVLPFERLEHMQKSLEQLGGIGEIHANIHGLGLMGTITALVEFPDERELRKVLEIEQLIKVAGETDIRNFSGHISLAYFVRNPAEKIQAIKDALRPYSDQQFGEFSFSEFDLTFFTDMNTFIPLLSVNLLDSTVTHHEKNVQELQSLLNHT